MSLTKNDQLLAYIVKKRGVASVTVLMKLAYLLDLMQVQNGRGKISTFKYIRWYYGPFDDSIYSSITRLEKSQILNGRSEYDNAANESIVYRFDEKKEDEHSFDLLSQNEMAEVDAMTRALQGYGAKTLTEISYKTAPMVAIGATLGGNQSMGVELDLSAA